MSVRQKVWLELTLLALCTVTFLVSFPRRVRTVDLALAMAALLGIGLSARYTKRVIWAASPPPVTENRFRRSAILTLWITVPIVLLFLAIGVCVAYRGGGWPAVIHRVINWRILAAFGFYLIWALLQQTLFQFYLLGRLLVLFPQNQPMAPIVLTGIGFALVHLPDTWTTLATIPAGILWTFLYYRYRNLLPLAFSHAALGSAFYYGIFGQDLATEWRSLF